MKNPKISVLMPVYNGEKYLKEAIDSILNQTYKDFEFIIINDGSTDASENIILSYNDKRIRYIKNSENLKLIKTLNKGIDMSRGEYIARMDCDDISFSNRFEKQVYQLEHYPELDGICAKAIDLLPHNQIKRSLRYLPLHKDAFRFTSLFEISFCHPCLMIRTDVLKKHRFLDNNTTLHIEDMELGSRLSMLNYNIEILDDFLIYYRKNPTGICFTHREEQKKLSYNLAKNNLFVKLNYELNKDFYNLLTDKKGFDSINKLIFARKELHKLVKLYLNSNVNMDTISHKDIVNWMRVREFAFIISAVNEVKGFKQKIIVFLALIISIKNFTNIFLFRYMFIWIQDWSCIAKKKFLTQK